jgi:hypothetical protein
MVVVVHFFKGPDFAGFIPDAPRKVFVGEAVANAHTLHVDPGELLCAVDRALRLKPRLLEVSDLVSVVGCLGFLQAFKPAVHSVRVIQSF